MKYPSNNFKRNEGRVIHLFLFILFFISFSGDVQDGTAGV